MTFLCQFSVNLVSVFFLTACQFWDRFLLQKKSRSPPIGGLLFSYNSRSNHYAILVETFHKVWRRVAVCIHELARLPVRPLQGFVLYQVPFISIGIDLHTLNLVCRFHSVYLLFFVPFDTFLLFIITLFYIFCKFFYEKAYLLYKNVKKASIKIETSLFLIHSAHSIIHLVVISTTTCFWFWSICY